MHVAVPVLLAYVPLAHATHVELADSPVVAALLPTGHPEHVIDDVAAVTPE